MFRLFGAVVLKLIKLNYKNNKICFYIKLSILNVPPRFRTKILHTIEKLNEKLISF